MEKLDLKKEYRELYRASEKRYAIIEVPELSYLTIDGQGTPGGEGFQEAIGALYGLAYGIKFSCKEQGRDFTVMPLETIWWMDGAELSEDNRDSWSWKLLIAVPDYVGNAELNSTREAARKKKDSPRLKDVRLESMGNGKAAQLLHVGPYDEVGRTVERLEELVKADGYAFSGRHHEIYLNDPCRVDVSRLKTIVRHPIKELGAG